MKKYIAVFAVVTLLCGVCGAVGVSAQTTTTASATQSSEATTTTEGSTTAVETTLATETETTVTTGGTTTATQMAQGSVKTKLLIINEDDKIVAKLTTVAGEPVANMPVALQIGTTKMPAEITDAQGKATFRYAFPTDDTYIYCSTELTMLGGILYEAAAASVGKQVTVATTVPSGETTANNNVTTTYPSSNRTYRTVGSTVKTQATEKLTVYTATGTTGKEETHLTIDFSFDSGVLDAFRADQTDFAQTAKLLLTPECYNQMLAGASGFLTMSAMTSTATVTDEQVAAAVAEDAVLSRADAADVERIVLDLSLQLKDAQTGRLTDIWNVATGDYVIQLPIPHSMRNAQTIVVAAVTAEGISAPVYANISKDGFIRFESTTPVGTIAILGFKGSVLGALTGHAVRSAVIFFVLGLLCIGGAVLLYVKFVHRPKPPKKSDAADDLPIREDAAETVSESGAVMQPEIFDDDVEMPAPLTKPKAPDIDIPL